MYNVGNWTNNNQNDFYNQYQPRPMMGMSPHYDIITVHGEAGAKNFAMGPNSKTFLLDETNPTIVWFAQTDGTGYLQVTPYDISLHQNQPQIDINDLSIRVAKLEELINNVQQSNSGDARQPKKRQSGASTKSSDPTD